MRATSASSYRWLLAGLVVLCGLGLARPAPTADVKVALVVGNTHYTGNIQSLENATTDAKSVAEALTKDGFSVTVRYDLNKADFTAALDDFAHASESADISLFYYAGHGVQYRGQNYLLPTDNAPRDNQDIRFKSVSMKDVVDAAIDARKAKIIILDACRNGKPDPAKAGSRAVTGLGDASGLAAVKGSDGLLVFYSAQPDKQALDKGPFASSLAKHIAEPGRDIQDVFKEVTKDVVQQTGAAQEPEQVTASLTEPVFLSPEETPEAAWQKIYKSDDPEAFKDFMTRFPDSYLADAAKTKLDNIDLERRAREAEQEQQEQKAEEARRAAAQEQANKERERQEAARQEAERQRQARDDAEKAAREKELAALQAQKQASDAAIAAQLKKAEEERQKIAAQVEAERAKRQQAEADARQKAEEAAKAEADAIAARKLAQQQNDAQQREAARREAERKAREAQAADDAARQAQAEIARQKAAEEARQRQAQLDEKAERDRIAKITADACAKDLAQLDKYKQARLPDMIQSLRVQSVCPTIGPAADQAIRDVEAAVAKTCDVERKMLESVDIRNETALKSALGRSSCGAVRQEAEGLLAKLEDEKQRMVATCAAEGAAVSAIDPAARGAKPQLLALRAKAACPDTAKAIGEIVSAIDERVAAAQSDLNRLACLDRDKESGAFDDATVAALTKYLQSRNAPVGTPRITKGLVDELHGQVIKFCAPPQDQPVVASKGNDATRPGTTGAQGVTEPKATDKQPASSPPQTVRRKWELAEAPRPKPKHALAASSGGVAPATNRTSQPASSPAVSFPIGTSF